MSLDIQFSKILALRKFGSEGMPKEHCLPEKLESDRVYEFIKSGQRVFDLKREIPLHETKGNENLSNPLALIRILEITHYEEESTIWTKGKYIVNEIAGKEDLVLWDAGKYIIKKR